MAEQDLTLADRGSALIVLCCISIPSSSVIEARTSECPWSTRGVGERVEKLVEDGEHGHGYGWRDLFGAPLSLPQALGVRCCCSRDVRSDDPVERLWAADVQRRCPQAGGDKSFVPEK
jgi:hypothetical protein